MRKLLFVSVPTFQNDSFAHQCIPGGIIYMNYCLFVCLL